MENIIERIKTKPEYKILFLLFVLILPFYLLHLINESELNNIKNSDDEIICNIKGKGTIIIDKSKIIGFTDDGGFIFENGYAKNCYIEKKGE